MNLMVRILLFLILSHSLWSEPGDDIYQQGFLSPAEAHKSIQLQDDYSLELVLSDPHIREPVAMAWDGNGALYVVEMHSYMQDADATGERNPTSRITRHEDTNGDGVYDKHSVFIDNLVLPRMVLPLDDRIMVGITNTLDLWTYRDSDNDGIADEKVKIYEGGKRGGNMEHQPSGLVWNLDNSIYITYESQSYRFTDETLEVIKLPRGGGQWGIGQDDVGRLYYCRAGGEVPVEFFQQPIKYGALNLKGQTNKGFNEVFPIAEVPDVQGGARRLNNRGCLNNFTGCAGPGIYRGDRLPSDLRGDYLLPEPVGRLIRRAKPIRENGKTILSNSYPKSEFIRATDINFRPLGATTSPDGAMMIIDMHRGIIQQGNWTRPDSYLRKVIDKWELAKNIQKGRIYRLTHPTFKPDKQPRMLDETTSELVAHLAHPNGWWRDTAQKLIILRKDRESVAPALIEMAKNHSSELARLHALWTLEGMSQLSPELVSHALTDSSSIIRTSAIQLAEPYMKSDDESVISALLSSPQLNEDIEMVIQSLNSINTSGTENSQLKTLSNRLLKEHGNNETIQAISNLQGSAVADQKAQHALKRRGGAFAKAIKNGKQIYEQLCFSCHGGDGKGTPMPGQNGHFLAPSFAYNPRLQGTDNAAILTLLHGLSGDLDGKEYEGLMVSMATNDDQWIADVTTYIRNSFGNESGLTEPKAVAHLRKEHESRKEPWTQDELEELSPPFLTNRENWKLTASNGAKNLDGCVDGDLRSRYTTEASMKPGMWVQVELPKLSKVTNISLDARRSAGDFPRQYQVQVSSDGKKWSPPIAQGNGVKALTDISFEPIEAKFVRITQTGKHRLFWSIHELNINGIEL